VFEHRRAPLLPRAKFYARLAQSAALGVAIILIALVVGMVGYHHFESMSWIDSFANASMILSGMGPFGPLQTDSGKLFAGVYALFSGLAFILIVGLMFGPVVHRFLHKFHLETQSDQPGRSRGSKEQ
jgi:hypothetical protein